MESADYERGFDDGFILRKEKAGDYKAMYLKVRDELAELQQREWVGLTDKEFDDIYEHHHDQYAECISVNFGYERAIEAKLREKNT